MNLRKLLSRVHSYHSFMLMGVFGAFGGGKTLFAVRNAEKAMNKCVHCGHHHPVLRADPTKLYPNGVPVHLTCNTVKKLDKYAEITCGCHNFKGIRVFANMYIEGAEYITPEQFMNIVTEREIKEYEGEPEFKQIPGRDIVEKFETCGFIVIREDEVGLVVIDEVYQWVDARQSGSRINLDIDAVILQSRKKGVDVCYTSQLPSAVDKRLRLNTELAVIAKKQKKHREVTGFKYVMATDSKVNVKVLKKADASKYYKFYNTRQSVEKPMEVDQRLTIYVKVMMERIRRRRAQEIKELNQRNLDEAAIAMTARGQLMELDKTLGIEGMKTADIEGLANELDRDDFGIQ